MKSSDYFNPIRRPPSGKPFNFPFYKTNAQLQQNRFFMLFLRRFSVSTVDGEKKNGIHMGASIISRPLRSSAETAERGGAGGVVGPPTQPDTWLHDAGWRRKRSLAQLTREALPRMENYRNSKRALKRPSLGELHGDHLITEEVRTLTQTVNRQARS